MANKINFKYVDQKYLSEKVKNPETGRRFLQIECPFCSGLTFDKRDFYDHVIQVHAKRKDEVLAKLFGLQYPVLCSCGKTVTFDENTGIYSRKCRYCLASDKSLHSNASKELSLEELMEQQRNLEATFKAKQEEIAAQIEAAKRELEWKSVDIYSMKPRFLPEAAKFVRKISYELRVSLAGGQKDYGFKILNYLDKYLDTEGWKEVVKND